MNHWALELKPDGKGHEVDAAEACSTRESPAIFVWVHLDGREQDTLQWLQLHGGMPITVIYALTAMETRPRSEAVAHGALINLRGPSADDSKNGEDRLVSIRVWVEQGRAISVSFAISARESITNFEKGVGDVAVTYENEIVIGIMGNTHGVNSASAPATMMAITEMAAVAASREYLLAQTSA